MKRVLIFMDDDVFTVRNIIVLFWPFCVKTSDIYNTMLIVTSNVRTRIKLTEDTVPCCMPKANTSTC